MPRKRRSTARPVTVVREHVTPAAPEFGRHHDVETRASRDGGIAGWRVRTRLDTLHQPDGLIDAAQWQAGDNYRRDLEVGELGGRLAAIGEGGGRGDGCPTVSRMAALARLAGARDALTIVQRLAMDGLAADLSWPALGDKIGCGRDAARTVVIKALGVLADHYKLRSRAARIRTAEIVG